MWPTLGSGSLSLPSWKRSVEDGSSGGCCLDPGGKLGNLSLPWQGRKYFFGKRALCVNPVSRECFLRGWKGIFMLSWFCPHRSLCSCFMLLDTQPSNVLTLERLADIDFVMCPVWGYGDCLFWVIKDSITDPCDPSSYQVCSGVSCLLSNDDGVGAGQVCLHDRHLLIHLKASSTLVRLCGLAILECLDHWSGSGWEYLSS